MALNPSTIFEVRTTGSQVNGGGFYNRVPGTSVDYSQQDTAQLTLTDLATDVAGTGLSSATGGFTAAMVGNIIQISGGTLTAGWYEITAYTDTNNVTIDRTAGASKTGGTGNVGGAFLLGGALDDNMFSAVVAGNTVYIKAGTYTLSEAVSGNISGSSTAMKHIIGYDSSRGDAPTGTNRPRIDCGASYSWEAGAYEEYSYIRWTGSAANVVLSSRNHQRFVECKCSNTSATVNRYAFRDNSYGSTWVHCEANSTAGYAFAAGAGSWFLSCYAHDSTTGFNLGSEKSAAIGCVAAGCSLYGVLSQAGVVMNCVIYDCGTGVMLNTDASVCANSIVHSCTTGVDNQTAGDQSHYQDYNCLYNN